MTRLPFVLLLCSCIACAEWKLPPRFEPVARLATSVPAELGSDALLRLLESHKISDKKTALELTQEAFDLAAASHFRAPAKPKEARQPDTSLDSLAKAYELGLDTVSLQSRAAQIMQGLDGDRARDMLRAIGTPELKDQTGPESAYWQSAPAQRIMKAALNLRMGDSTVLPDLLNDLNAWTASSEPSETDYYNERCIVSQALVEVIPPGPDRDKMVQSFVDFVAGSNLETHSPAEWFAPIEAMLKRVRNTNNGEPAKLLAAFDASGNPALILLAHRP